MMNSRPSIFRQPGIGEGHYRPCRQCRCNGQHRRNDEYALVGATGTMISLSSNLETVRNRLYQAKVRHGLGQYGPCM